VEVRLISYDVSHYSEGVRACIPERGNEGTDRGRRELILLGEHDSNQRGYKLDTTGVVEGE
jgi:hypothetical protein